MRLRILSALVAVLLLASTVRADEPAILARARTLYNAADYDGAIEAASEAQRLTESSDAAALVLARAHLERYRQRADPCDLAAARDALLTIRQAALGPRDRVDLLVGLGQSLYLGENFGAAAELFEAALMRGSLLSPGANLLLLDWWASALDREAQSRRADARRPVFERILTRMERVLSDDPSNPVASYWLAASARGAGDLERAWDAAVAGWVRATLNPEQAESVRADLDRLVTQALIPERARHNARPGLDPETATAALRTEWDLIKTQWR